MRGCILQVYCKMQLFFFFYKLIIAVKFRFLKAPHNWWKKLPEKQKNKSATPARLPFGRAYEAPHSYCIGRDNNCINA